MQTEMRAGWVRLADAQAVGRPCSVLDCPRPAVAVEQRRTDSMPATGFYPVCAEHMELPSARAALLADLPVHALPKKGWAIYPVGGEEYDLYPGDEGPQREMRLDEALEAIGGDQACRLAQAGVIKWPIVDRNAQAGVLAGECLEPRRECPDLPAIFRTQQTIERMVEQGWLSADDARPVLVALENARHESVLKSL